MIEKLNEFLNKELFIDLTDTKVLTFIVLGIICSMILFVGLIILSKKNQAYARSCGSNLFNLNLLLFALPPVLFMYVDYLKNNLILLGIITAVVWIIPFVFDITKMGMRGIVVALLQFVYGIIASTLINAAVSLAIMVVVLICGITLGLSFWVDDIPYFRIRKWDGTIVYIRKSGYYYVDTDGNKYTYSKATRKFLDSDYNEYVLYQ